MKAQADHMPLFLKRVCKKYPPGFTLTELCITMAIITVLSALAVPAIKSQIPNIQLRQAARDLYSQMQWAKIAAIKDNSTRRMFFDPAQQRYEIWSEGPNRKWDKMTGDDILEKQIHLSDYGPDIIFGPGNAKFAATVSHGKIPKDGISYNEKNAHFNHNGTVGELGYIYLRNEKGENFAVGTINIAGHIVCRRWKGNRWD